VRGFAKRTCSIILIWSESYRLGESTQAESALSRKRLWQAGRIAYRSGLLFGYFRKAVVEKHHACEVNFTVPKPKFFIFILKLQAGLDDLPRHPFWLTRGRYHPLDF